MASRGRSRSVLFVCTGNICRYFWRMIMTIGSTHISYHICHVFRGNTHCTTQGTSTDTRTYGRMKQSAARDCFPIPPSRSPMAETVFIQCAKEKRVYSDWPRVDSAGTTDWNEGSLPDYRAAAVLNREGLKVNDSPAMLRNVLFFSSIFSRSLVVKSCHVFTLSYHVTK